MIFCYEMYLEVNEFFSVLIKFAFSRFYSLVNFTISGKRVFVADIGAKVYEHFYIININPIQITNNTRVLVFQTVVVKIIDLVFVTFMFK